MQLYWNEFFQQRVLLNASKAVVRQLGKGMNYKLIQPVYCLNLVNDIGFESAPDEFYHDYAIVNVEHSDRIIEGLRFVYVELPKFTPKTIAERKMAVLWLRFLTEINLATETVPAELLENELTSKALSIVERSAMSEAQLNAYEKYWINLTDEEGLALARYKRGLAEGRKNGLVEGEAKGRTEERMANARRMKELSIDRSVISQVTGLTKEEIEIKIEII